MTSRDFERVQDRSKTEVNEYFGIDKEGDAPPARIVTQDAAAAPAGRKTETPARPPRASEAPIPESGTVDAPGGD